ncbi:copper chaperone PCu(A)C [Rhodovibrio salinarum]|uniref:Copper chaperone PCu(A)C n=1 Tax=Rhodovibrio salinarum TaxID=1087 RepID=A0A934QEG9_9PROT|nr:copper chaperone PCu(A)C [Rhodovibrio salinarum]MBK1695797.1 copper chaperone PCu(A)C [Rhodovibrio salinarum]
MNNRRMLCVYSAVATVISGCLIATAGPAAAAGQAEQVQVSGAHALVSPMHEGGGVFMTLRNAGDGPAVITAASVPVASTVSLDRCMGPSGMQPGQGMQRQRSAPAEGPLAIPAGSTVTLQRGSRHLCMTGTNERFRLGAEFPLTLTFEDGSTKTVPLKVEGVAKPRRGQMQGQGFSQ